MSTNPSAATSPVLRANGKFLPFTLFLTLSLGVGACAAGRAHENFRQSVQWDVGRTVMDPNVLLNRYPEKRGIAHPLPNGNTDQEFRFRHGCTVFFEIDHKLQKIVRWHYEGNDDDCVLVP